MQGGRRVSGDPCVDLGFIARTHAEQVHGTVLRTASELSVFVKSLAGFAGCKTLLYVSDGIPLIAEVVLSSLFHDLQENPLNARLEMAKSAAVTKNVFSLTMRVHIPLSGLITVAEGDLQIGHFTVFVGVKDGNGSIKPVGHQTLPFRITAADRQQDPDREYIYKLEIPVRGNEQLVAVAVRDQLGGTASYVSKSVQLASEADSG